MTTPLSKTFMNGDSETDDLVSPSGFPKASQNMIVAHLWSPEALKPCTTALCLRSWHEGTRMSMIAFCTRYAKCHLTAFFLPDTQMSVCFRAFLSIEKLSFACCQTRRCGKPRFLSCKLRVSLFARPNHEVLCWSFPVSGDCWNTCWKTLKLLECPN